MNFTTLKATYSHYVLSIYIYIYNDFEHKKFSQELLDENSTMQNRTMGFELEWKIII